ncbi:Hypothetical protein, putative [Bodo saltans]|uniref:Uncharacterized protein n=1 Tax=Bodo saltans TaxID=75058 RepID=A0A0S4J7A5_BODSA|nr:Hypothetical protein, putative [Bodo saltans]|eukprot:CUG85714.1 Hypothetical protein, putative [Bodo saltans]
MSVRWRGLAGVFAENDTAVVEWAGVVQRSWSDDDTCVIVLWDAGLPRFTCRCLVSRTRSSSTRCPSSGGPVPRSWDEATTSERWTRPPLCKQIYKSTYTSATPNLHEGRPDVSTSCPPPELIGGAIGDTRLATRRQRKDSTTILRVNSLLARNRVEDDQQAQSR